MQPFIIPLAVISLILTPSVTTYKANLEPLPKEVILSDYDIELEAWVEKLAKCESGNNEKAINHFDGGSESIGYVQYKTDTWRRYNEKFNLSFNPEDIWSKEAQIEVTKHVIKEDYAWRNWYNCSKAVGLPPVFRGDEISKNIQG